MYSCTLCGQVIGPKGWSLKTWFTPDGYKQFTFYQNGKRKTKQVGRFIYEFFYGPTPEGLVVDHIDSDRANNKLSNLQAITLQENVQKGKLGKLSGQEDRDLIVMLYSAGWLQREIAERFNLSRSRISTILKEERNKTAFYEEGM